MALAGAKIGVRGMRRRSSIYRTAHPTYLRTVNSIASKVLTYEYYLLFFGDLNR